MHIFDTHFWINFVLAMTMQWFWTLWIGVIRPRNWKLPLKWVGWALIPAVIGTSWSLAIPPVSALLYLNHHRPKMSLIFVNATIVIFLVVVLVNDVVRAVTIELFGFVSSQTAPVITGRLVFQVLVYTLCSLAVSGMRIQPGNLEELAFSRKEQWTVMALLASMSVLAQLSTVIIHRLAITHAMMTFALSIELVMILLISMSLFFFLQSFFHRQRVKAGYQELLLRSRYDRRISDQVRAIRQFKQQYQKQMLRLGDYLDTADYDGLTAYFQTLDSRWHATSHVTDLEEDGLQRLSDPPLKSLLFQKILAAQAKGRDLRLEIPNKVRTFPIDSLLLIRIVGILLDNALESAPVAGQQDIHFAILTYPGSVEISVANPVSQEDPPQINRFLTTGYTTKGTGHGQGLKTVQEIVMQTDNASLQIALKRGMLYFTLILTKEGG